MKAIFFFRNCHHILVLDLYGTACFLLTRVFFPVHERVHTLTSTENFFPKVNRKGCISISGSFWKQLGLAWCRECRRVHHLADAPCFSEEQSMKSIMLSEPDSLQFPYFAQCWTRYPPQSLQNTYFYRKAIKSKKFFQGQVLTIKWHITNLCSKWFHLVFLNTERCPKSCCNHEAWTWKRKKKIFGGGGQGGQRGIETRTMPHLSFALKYQDLFLGQCSKVTIRKELWNPDTLEASPRIYLAERIPD